MRLNFVPFGTVTIVALNMILLMGTSIEPPTWFSGLVLVMDGSLVSSIRVENIMDSVYFLSLASFIFSCSS
jgi:hypothetical protein